MLHFIWYFAPDARLSAGGYGQWENNKIIVLEGVPSAHLFNHIAASSSKPTAGQRDSSVFWVADCDGHISYSEIPGEGFLVSTKAYHSLSSEPQWWLLCDAKKSLSLNQHLSPPGLEGSRITQAGHSLAVHYFLVQLGYIGTTLEFQFLHWKSTLLTPDYSHEVLHYTHTHIAAAPKSLQSCPTLCDPIDGSPPGSSVPGILQARTLEWVAISFSNAGKWKMKVKSLSRV